MQIIKRLDSWNPYGISPIWKVSKTKGETKHKEKNDAATDDSKKCPYRSQLDLKG